MELNYSKMELGQLANLLKIITLEFCKTTKVLEDNAGASFYNKILGITIPTAIKQKISKFEYIRKFKTSIGILKHHKVLTTQLVKNILDS